MSNFVLDQNASTIQALLNKVETPQTVPTAGSQALVTSGGVKTYVDTEIANNQEEVDFANGYDDAGTSGTATSAGFLIATAIRNSNYSGNNTISLTITVGTTSFQTKEQSLFNGEKTVLTIPIAKSESYTITVGSNATLESSKFKAFS